ncbi:MAG: hypothetical protein LRY76_07810 [Alphaproteobacteria bacterium]|nr:hypothetical protein [Alphaproteobacteria bacterium]MCD8526217.1 hypothetical protein [Alphaproteobacteria bacterium]MCD8571407.1 hypothetical protein [Alphaproteobacteria bacterium]
MSDFSKGFGSEAVGNRAATSISQVCYGVCAASSAPQADMTLDNNNTLGIGQP